MAIKVRCDDETLVDLAETIAGLAAIHGENLTWQQAMDRAVSAIGADVYSQSAAELAGGRIEP